MMHGSILFWVNQNLNLIDLLIYTVAAFNGILSNILSFTNLILIHMVRNMNSQFTVVLAMKLPFIIMSIIFSHLNVFKYHNMISNLNRVTQIHSYSSLVGYLLTSLNKRL